MENNENNESVNDQIVPNAEVAGGENNQELNENQELTPPSFNDQLINWAKENGREVADVNDLLKPVEVEKVVEKEVDPWGDTLDEEDRAYMGFKKENPGKGRKDFEEVYKNWDEVPAIEVARERVRKENPGLTLNDSQIDDHLESELGLDLAELDTNGQIKLNQFANSLRNEKKAEQEKYRKPVENKEVPQEQPANKEYIKLPNGAVMLKADHEAELLAQGKEKELAVQAVKTVTATQFKISVDDKGTVTDVAIPYEYQAQDSQKMESIVSDLQGTINKRYNSEQGFNHAAFAEDMLWSEREFREKTISDIATKARAQGVEETLKAVGNHNFNPDKPLDKQTTEGVRFVPFNELGKR